MKIGDKVTLSTLQGLTENTQQSSVKKQNLETADKLAGQAGDTVDISSAGSTIKELVDGIALSFNERQAKIDLLKEKLKAGAGDYLQSLSSNSIAESFNSGIALEIGIGSALLEPVGKED